MMLKIPDPHPAGPEPGISGSFSGLVERPSFSISCVSEHRKSCVINRSIILIGGKHWDWFRTSRAPQKKVRVDFVSIAYFFTKFSNPVAPPGDML